MKNLSKKDWAVLAMAFAMAMPALMIFNENMSAWYYNVIGIVYALWIVRKLTNTKIGKAFCARMERIERKVFSPL